MYIEMPRGDYRPFRFLIKNKSGTALDIDVDEIYISCKKNIKTSTLLFQKKLTNGDITKGEDGYYHFKILPQDTEELPYDDYVFDIEIYNQIPFIKQTVLGDLTLTGEVTHKKDEVS